MKKTIMVASFALLASVFGGMSFTRAQAAQTVSQAVTYTLLKGNYSFASLANDDGDYPSSGTFTFDGKGHVSGVMNLYNDDSVCAGMTLVGTYTVNPGLASGFAIMSLTSVSTGGCGLAGNGDTLPVAIAIGSSGNSLYLAEMDDESSGYFGDDFAFFAGPANHY
jgi:hypothetical protein